MYKTIPIILLSLLLPVSPAASRAATGQYQLPEFHAQYAALFMGMKVAEAHYDLSHTDTGYRFTQKTRLYGLADLLRSDTVDVVSEIEEKDGRLLLQKYEYRQRGGENGDEKFSIRWDKSTTPPTGHITGSYNGREIKLVTEGPIWEPLSFQLPLMIEAGTTKKDYPYRAVLKGEIDTYHFVLGETRNIRFAGREYLALQVIRKDPRKDHDRQLHIWLIPELHNIPFLIDNYRDGKLHSRIKLEQLQFNHGEKMIQQDDSDDEF